MELGLKISTMRHIIIFGFILTNAVEASGSAYKIIEVEATPANLPVKVPASQRRSPIDALNGVNRTVVMQPQTRQTQKIEVIHRSPLDALNGRPNGVVKVITTGINPRVARHGVKKITHKKIVKINTLGKTKNAKLLAMVTTKRVIVPKKSTISPMVTSSKKLKKPIHTSYKNNNSIGKILYLTFDDGPLRGTQSVINATKEEGVEATMFFIGKHVQMNRSLFAKAASMPNLLVANHTYSHANGKYEEFYNDTEKVLKDIDRAQRIIGGSKYLRLCGRNVWRLPDVNRDDYGIGNRQRAREIADYDGLQDKGYQIYGWDIEWRYDHSTKMPLWGAEEMARKINAKYNSGYTARRGKMILLAHDFMFKGLEGKYELKELISMLKSQGWRFATLSSYTEETPGVFVKLKKLKEPKKIVKEKAPTVVIFPKEQTVISKNLKDRKSDSSTRELMLTTRLNDAVISFDPAMVRKLIRDGANINSIDQSGKLALNTAVRVNNITIVKILIRHGAKINNRDAKGASPILIAKRYHRLAIGSYLINQLNIQKNDTTIALKEKTIAMTK